MDGAKVLIFVIISLWCKNENLQSPCQGKTSILLRLVKSPCCCFKVWASTSKVFLISSLFIIPTYLFTCTLNWFHLGLIFQVFSHIEMIMQEDNAHTEGDFWKIWSYPHPYNFCSFDIKKIVFLKRIKAKC